MTTRHPDPTFNKVQRVEEDEYGGCPVCLNRIELCGDEARCMYGLKYPFCRGAKNGFDLDMGRAA